MPAQTAEVTDVSPSAARKPAEEATSRKPRRRERGFGRQQTTELLNILGDTDLFERRGDVRVLVGTRSDLAQGLEISRQALSGRLSRLRKHGVVLGVNPLRIDKRRLERISLGEPSSDPPDSQRGDDAARDPRIPREITNRMVGASKESENACGCPGCGNITTEIEQAFVNVCSAIKCLLSTFDNALSSVMNDCLIKINQTNLENQTFTDYQTFTDQDLTRARVNSDQTFTNQRLHPLRLRAMRRTLKTIRTTTTTRIVCAR